MVQYIPYRDLSRGIPGWARLSFMWRRVFSAFRIQRAYRTHRRRREAAIILQRWWIRQSYVVC